MADHSNFLLRGCHPMTLSSIDVAGDDTTAGTAIKGNNNIFTIKCKVKTTEPLFISPLLFAGVSKNSPEGLVGFNQMNLSMNLSSNYQNYWCSSIAGAATSYVISLTNIQSYLYVN